MVIVGLMGGSVEISLPMFVLQNKSLQGVGTSGIAGVQDLVRVVAEHKVCSVKSSKEHCNVLSQSKLQHPPPGISVISSHAWIIRMMEEWGGEEFDFLLHTALYL